jgi:uncharacterized membrane-anchored protein YitT (DUF2179 family)
LDLHMKNLFKGETKSSIYLIIGVLCATVGLNAFLIPNGFFDGGAMGISLLLQKLTGIGLSWFIILINLPFILISAKQVSIRFAIKSVLAITLLAITVHFLSFPPVTTDRLLVSVFGGVFLGLGIGFAIRGGAVIDGSEVLAIQVSRQTTFTVGDFIAVFNVILFCVVAVMVDVQSAMYSMLTYFSASRTVDFILNGIEEYIGMTIISPKTEEMREMLTEELGRGVTVYKTEGGYGKRGSVREERKALFCVVTRLEVTRLIQEVERIDPQAFVVQHPVKDTRGGMIKKRAVH